MKTGIIGLGAMGIGMAKNLSKAGLLQAVWNRTAEKAQAFAVEIDCTVASSAAGLASQCDAIIICVSADDDVLQMIDAIAPTLSAGKLVIDCSTVSKATAIEAAKRCSQSGAGFLDAPISGGVEGAKNGTLSIMCGGSEADFARAAPVFEAIGQTITHMGPTGSGQATKAVNQVMCAGINQAVCEAMAFAKAQELPLEKVVDVVSAGAAGSWFLKNRGGNMIQGQYPYGFKLSLHHKDLKICEAMTAGTTTCLPLTHQTAKEYESLMAEGYGDEDISALFRRR